MMLTNSELFEKYRTIPHNVYRKSFGCFWKYKEDLIQEGYLRIWYCMNKLDQTMTEGEQASYLYRAVWNCMNKYIFNKQYKHDRFHVDLYSSCQEGVNNEFLDSYISHKDVYIDHAVISSLERALLRDPLAFKRYVQSKQISEIANEEGVSRSKVSYNLNLFKNKIRAIIFRDGVCFDIEPEVYAVCETLRDKNR